MYILTMNLFLHQILLNYQQHTIIFYPFFLRLVRELNIYFINDINLDSFDFPIKNIPLI
jgi:hypothetical protein